jgi:hypothetical protein
MIRLIHTSGVAVLLLGLNAMVGTQNAAIGQSAQEQAIPDQITTDTLAYCQQLAQRFQKMTGGIVIPLQVSDLAAAGRHMCDEGLTRAGIMRLRMAIVTVLHEQGGPPPPDHSAQ